MLSRDGELEKEFKRITWSFMDPHSTGKARTCEDCHTSAKTVGLGYGSLTYLGHGQWHFESAEREKSDLLGLDFPLSAVTDLNGKVFVNFSRKDLRAFTPEEIKRILRVGLCLPCHKDFSDPVMKNWKPGLTCPVFKENNSN
ncbi:hypothetical protein [Thermodesulfatator autotrophicus]|uniref:Cytochrome c-552/4 domain-containing protein n=1 Tax=Thermodesulfatator autotrophicus TaxID=1795632 RepID=A0A177E622_9BACT|nr:hypothetical protein [Thermodesulfatator autotrophicus]OAG27413.1 hypothetical protein TH606_07010 [Thermodesulfatator autotrophicus]